MQRNAEGASAPLRRISGQGQAAATIRYDANEHEVDVYVYVCQSRPGTTSRLHASVESRGCSRLVDDVGDLSMLTDGRTEYVHGTKPRETRLPEGWWIAVTEQSHGQEPSLRFCGEVT